jgi:hypothetical protein
MQAWEVAIHEQNRIPSLPLCSFLEEESAEEEVVAEEESQGES